MKKLINEAITRELETANSKYPLFQTDHEAYAVLREEIEEAVEECDRLPDLIENMWGRVRIDMEVEQVINIIEKVAENLISEAVQVAAMCRKTRDSVAMRRKVKGVDNE
jgi:hypothetical protein